MANDLSTNPWKLDTPSPFVPGAGVNQVAVLWRDWIKVDHFELVNYVFAAGGQATLKNRNGQIVAILSAAADAEEVRTGGVGWIEGLIFDNIAVLASANVLVYLSR